MCNLEMCIVYTRFVETSGVRSLSLYRCLPDGLLDSTVSSAFGRLTHWSKDTIHLGQFELGGSATRGPIGYLNLAHT
jgi:hypothetical protein